jgi:hypothetical protein
MTEFTVNITRNDEAYADEFEYYILNDTELQELQDGDLDLEGMAVYTGNDADDTFTYLAVDEGTYNLYVRTQDKKHDNMDEEPTFTVTHPTVTATPNLLVKNVDTDFMLEFSVSWNGEPLNGTLLVKGVSEVASFDTYVDDTYEVAIIDGEGNLTNVSAIAIGNITFEFMAEADGSVYVEATGQVTITTPEVEILEPEEKVAFLAEENLITIKVKHPRTGAGIEGLNVMIQLPTGNLDLGDTGADGTLLFGIVPFHTGKMKLFVDGEEAGDIEIKLGLKIHLSSEVEQDQDITITVTTRGGKTLSGVTVKVGGTTIGTTDDNGEIKYTFEEEGTFTLNAEKSGYSSESKTITVEEGASEGVPGFELLGVAIALVLIAFIIRRRKK